MDKGAILLALIGVLAVGLVSPAASADRYPSEVYAAGAVNFDDHLELKPLWRPGALNFFRQRLRVTIVGISTTSVSVELNQSSRGEWSGLLRERADGSLLDDVHFGVSKNAAQDLARLIERARLWTIYPQFFQGTQGNICIDGEVVTFERIDAAGYRYSEGNAQCTLASAQLDVAAKALELARRPELERLLR